MVRRPAAAALLLAAGLAGGCRARFAGAPAADAAADVGEFDGPQPLTLDIAVTGCKSYDPAVPRCLGAPPLTLSFAPVSSASLVRFLWTFGDGTPDSSDVAPVHSYLQQGDYDVTVVGASDQGTVSRTRRRLVSVAAVQAGGLCDVDGQCATGLACVCGAGTGCDAAFARGLCTAPCTDGACGAGAVCADLSPPAPGGGDGGADASVAPPLPPSANFRRPLCLAPCQGDADCPGGLRCRQLPGGGAPGQPRWVRACFPAIPGDVGQPCRDPSGALDDSACTSGSCQDLGALGLCSATCDPTEACPAGSGCAVLGDGRRLCLAACSSTGDCARDPLLDCEAPGASGALGFTLLGGATGGAYCAPRGCQTAVDCAPAGTCANAHCTRTGP
jgi:PKD repeat protein